MSGFILSTTQENYDVREGFVAQVFSLARFAEWKSALQGFRPCFNCEEDTMRASDNQEKIRRSIRTVHHIFRFTKTPALNIPSIQ